MRLQQRSMETGLSPGFIKMRKRNFILAIAGLGVCVLCGCGPMIYQQPAPIQFGFATPYLDAGSVALEPAYAGGQYWYEGGVYYYLDPATRRYFFFDYYGHRHFCGRGWSPSESARYNRGYLNERDFRAGHAQLPDRVPGDNVWMSGNNRATPFSNQGLWRHSAGTNRLPGNSYLSNQRLPNMPTPRGSRLGSQRR